MLFTQSPFSPLNRPDFSTHLKYISLLAKLARGVSISSTSNALLTPTELPAIRDKVRLIELTKKSIDDECGIVQMDEEYSTAAVLWLPIKSYYLAYHLLCVIDCLMTGKTSQLRAKHVDCVKHFTGLLSSGSLQFSQPLFNQVFDKSILNFRSTSGANLRGNTEDDVVYKLIMKKVANEKIASWKLSHGITEVRTIRNRQRVESFKQSLTVSIFDFFYQMRLRLNYSNFDFIDNMPASQTKAYFTLYFLTASHFFNCFSNFKNKLITDISVGISP